MKLFICHNDKQLSKSGTCPKCKSKLYAFIADSNEAIFDIPHTDSIDGIKKSYKDKMLELNEFINRSNPHELCEHIDFQNIAAIYTNTHSLLTKNKDGVSFEYVLKKAKVISYLNKMEGLKSIYPIQ